MGFVENLIKKAAPSIGNAAGSSPELVQGLIKQLTDSKTGGLAGFVQALQQKGLGDIVNSWVSKGPNLPISTNQIQKAIGPDAIKNMAAQAGLSVSDAASQLSKLVPALVDKVTPDGKIPAESVLQRTLGLFKKSQP